MFEGCLEVLSNLSVSVSEIPFLLLSCSPSFTVVDVAGVSKEKKKYDQMRTVIPKTLNGVEW